MIELSEELCSGDKIFVCSTIWDTFDERNRLALIYKFYNLLNFDEQCTFFKLLGQKFNKLILEDSVIKANLFLSSKVSHPYC